MFDFGGTNFGENDSVNQFVNDTNFMRAFCFR
jgi:hypothetical protein